ncbi:proteasome assembly chaperone family protein [Candidatus Halobonum tyrrellensis]|uniref:PAC2 family protein n=1 Tax=Candidatus Halobonum tyrrellensis G22 TaxID=1324957 RepID=V4HDG3_9EURY|nr:PAC2 family protein [Candidatus Halobonum tyrrellensis]ESP88755.1 PAC2 family protein [Candidatus Halobonum tyrrellensis G22]
MTRIEVTAELTLDDPVLVEGFPGAGLVGKIAADHLVSAFGMTHYANVYCDSLPLAAAYADDDRTLRTPVRLYADADRDLVVLQSDVPVAPEAASEFAECSAEWVREESVTPLYLAGLKREGPADEAAGREVRGVATGDRGAVLDAAGIDPPEGAGLVSGPTGALLNHALDTGLDAVGLVVDCDPQFPDPSAAKAVLEDGVAPVAGVDVPTAELDESASGIQRAKEQLAEQIRRQEEKSSKAQPVRMYQ